MIYSRRGQVTGMVGMYGRYSAFMKYINYIFILCIIILSSCNREKSGNEWLTVKNTRSINSYQNFLIDNPQTKYLPEITDSLRIFWERYYYTHMNHDCFGNCLTLLINQNGQLLFESKPIHNNELKEVIKYSITNPDELIDLPEKKIVTIHKFGDFYVSRGVIDISTDKNLDPKIYSEIIGIVRQGFLELQNECSLKLYGKKLSKLNDKQKSTIDSIMPISMRFERYVPEPPTLPPSPPE